MPKPKIAITTSYESNRIIMSPAYFDALFIAGAIPSYLSRNYGFIRDIARDYDGFLFAGGVDVDPLYYGEETEHDSVEIDGERDKFEMALFAEVMNTGKPVFGICRGLQLMNAALGGSLHQHIEGHGRRMDKSIRTHQVEIPPESLLSTVTGETEVAGAGVITVNSYHHQAIKRLADGLCPAAISPDGIVEAAYLPGGRFFLGVQWHPELTFGKDSHSRAIFEAFVRSCFK